MATKLKEAAAARLMRQAAGNFGVLPTEPTKYQAIQPDAAAYSVYSPEYAKALGADTGFQGANILNTRALGVNAEHESQAYIQALAAAQANQIELQKQAGIINATDEMNKHNLDPDLNRTVGVGGIDQGTGTYIMGAGPAAVQTSENLNAEHADTLAKTAGAAKDLYGIGVKLPDLGYMIAPAGQQGPTATKDITVQVDMGEGIPPVEMTTDDANKYYDAKRRNDAAMVSALAAKYHSEHPTTSQSKTVVQYGIDGRPIVTTVTNPGADPPDSYAPNPKPDVRSGGTSGKPSAADLPPLDLAPVKQIGAEYGTVTSTTRSKEHNKEVGGQPNSYHLSGHAIDIARKPGVSHAQIKAAYQNAGYTLIESLDEGDHSHFAFAGGPSHDGAPPQRRPVPGGLDRIVHLAQAKGYANRITANGVEVSFPNGHKVVYNEQGKVTSASQ